MEKLLTPKGIEFLHKELASLHSTYGLPVWVGAVRYRFNMSQAQIDELEAWEQEWQPILGLDAADRVQRRCENIIQAIRSYREKTRESTGNDYIHEGYSLRDRAGLMQNGLKKKFVFAYKQNEGRLMDFSVSFLWRNDETLTPDMLAWIDVTNEPYIEVDRDSHYSKRWNVRVFNTVMSGQNVKEWNIVIPFKGRQFFTSKQEVLKSDHFDQRDLEAFRLGGVTILDEKHLQSQIDEIMEELHEMDELETVDQKRAKVLNQKVITLTRAIRTGEPVPATIYFVRHKYMKYADDNKPITGEGFTLSEALSLMDRRVRQETYKAL